MNAFFSCFFFFKLIFPKLSMVLSEYFKTTKYKLKNINVFRFYKKGQKTNEIIEEVNEYAR